MALDAFYWQMNQHRSILLPACLPACFCPFLADGEEMGTAGSSSNGIDRALTDTESLPGNADEDPGGGLNAGGSSGSSSVVVAPVSVHIVAGAGHAVHVERSEAVVPVLRRFAKQLQEQLWKQQQQQQ